MDGHGQPHGQEPPMGEPMPLQLPGMNGPLRRYYYYSGLDFCDLYTPPSPAYGAPSLPDDGYSLHPWLRSPQSIEWELAPHPPIQQPPQRNARSMLAQHGGYVNAWQSISDAPLRREITQNM
jgi:hypothetical protein